MLVSFARKAKKVSISTGCGLVVIVCLIYAQIAQAASPYLFDQSDLYVEGEFETQDLSREKKGFFADAVNTHDRFVTTAKKRDFNGLKAIFVAGDGSRDKFEALRSSFSKYRFYNDITSKKYIKGIAWGDYRFLIIDYKHEGTTRQMREDYFCPGASSCKKTMRDFGQAFEIGYYWQFVDATRQGLKITSNLGSYAFNITANIALPPQNIEINNNPYSVSLGVKTFKSNVCNSCPELKIDRSEENILSPLISFINGIASLDLTDPVRLHQYVEKFDKNHDRSTAFAINKWTVGAGKNIFIDVGGYLNRLKSWSGSVYGFIKSPEGIYVFLNIGSGDKDSFDMEMVFFEKRYGVPEYMIHPVGNSGSLEQTFLRDSQILTLFKNAFLANTSVSNP